MEVLEQLEDVFTMSAATTAASSDVPTDSAPSTVQSEAKVPRGTNCPPRVHNIPIPVPVLVV